MTETVANIAIGSDHAGYRMKEYLKLFLNEAGYLCQDFGTFTEDSMDYPDSAHPVAKAVNSGQFICGILICGSGNGMAIVANKYQEIRAALCWNEATTLLARQHNDANIVVFPARFINNEEAARFTLMFITTHFEGGRHERRIEKIAKIL
jgi:ribose 5-phosphate isomerase B